MNLDPGRGDLEDGGDRQTDTNTDRLKHRQTQTQTVRHKRTHTNTDRHTHRQRRKRKMRRRKTGGEGKLLRAGGTGRTSKALQAVIADLKTEKEKEENIWKTFQRNGIGGQCWKRKKWKKSSKVRIHIQLEKIDSSKKKKMRKILGTKMRSEADKEG